jgi:hypothetical protein
MNRVWYGETWIDSPRVSVEDARTFRKLADAAEKQGVRDAEHVAAVAAPEVSIDDAATATVAAAEALGEPVPTWALNKIQMRGDGE